MNNHLYVSTGAFNEKRLNNILKECESNGFLSLELSSGTKFSNLLLAKCKGLTGKMNFLVHNYFPAPAKSFVLNLASTDPKILKLSRSRLKLL